MQAKQPSWRLRYMNGATHGQQTRAEKEVAVFQNFIAHVVRPGFSRIVEQLQSTGRTFTTQETRASCTIIVFQGALQEMAFQISQRSYPTKNVASVEIKMHERRGTRIIRKTAIIQNAANEPIALEDIKLEDIENCFSRYYAEALKNLS